MELYLNSIWVSISIILVLLMNFGLAFFYSGLVSEKNILNTIKMTIVTLGLVPILWWAFAYSLVFSGNNPFIGNFDLAFLPVKPTDVLPNSKLLLITFICFHAMFANIAPAIISGSGAERLNFRSYLIFIMFWIIFVYCPLAHAIWNPNGWALVFGSFDFAGGMVVHISAGFSGLALALVLKPRKSLKESSKKNNLPIVVLGCGLLWFGWFGFNAGSALEVSSITIQAIANTLFATAGSLSAWILYDFFLRRSHTITGACNAIITGLVAITPSAGYVSTSAAIAIGAISSFVSYIISIYYNKLKHKLDDSLDVFTCHGIPAVLGSILLGVFASQSINPSIPNGVIYGNWSLLYKQVIVTIASAIYSFTCTYIIIYVLSKTIGIRVKEEVEKDGLDFILHGENAYNNQDNKLI